MEEGGLTQEEIDALLSVDEELVEEEAHSLDDAEKDKFTALITKAINAGCETLATMVGGAVSAEHITVESTSAQSLGDRFDDVYAVVSCPLELKKSHKHFMAIPMSLGAHMAHQMVNPGDDNAPMELDEMGQSAFESLMETFNGTLATTLANETKQSVGGGGPTFLKGTLADLQEELSAMAGEDSLSAVQYDLKVEGQDPVRAMSIFATPAVKALVEEPAMDPPPEKAADAGAPAAAAGAPAAAPARSYASAAPMIALPEGVDENLGRLLDIPLKITVVLGKTHLEIEKIMDLGAGSIVELNQVHGEPVSILVNGRLFAKGEVVVVEENFGVRISHIITPEERLSLLQ